MATITQPASGVPALPPGFTLDAPAPATVAPPPSQSTASGSVPPLPAGFTLDSAPPPDETAGRVAGLAGRALIKGAGDLVGMIPTAANAMSSVIDPVGTYLDKQEAQQQQPAGPYKPQLSDFVHPEKWQQAAEYFANRGADAAGLPTPATPAERIGSKAVEAIPSAVLAPEAMVPAAVSAAAGGAASQATKEAGYGPVAQTVAGLAAGSIPGVAANSGAIVRRLAGGDSAAVTQGRIADAAANGTNLDAGQATGSAPLQYLAGASSKLWGGGAIKANAEAQTESLGDHVNSLVDNLSQGTAPSPTTAGAAINAGAAATKSNMKAAETAAYNKVDSLVPANAPVDVSGTLAKLDELATPPPGASNTAGALISPKIAAMRDNLKADIAANGGSPTLPYEAATKLRTAVGNSIDWGFAPSDPVTNGAMKLVHGALKGDIDTSASAISPEAGQAVTDARTLYAQNQARRDALNAVIDKSGGPEAVYQAATNGTKQGATKIGGVMDALDPGQQNLVRATVIDRLGKAVPSAQNAAGGAFDPSTFLTNWSKLDPAAKDALFGASGTPNSLRAGLDSLTDTISNIRSGTKLRNPSGTAEAAGHMGGLIAAWEGVKHVITSAHPVAAGAAVAGGLSANYALAKALTNPRTVGWLAQTAKLPTSALPNAVNQLSKMGQANNDPDAQRLAAYLQQNSQQ
jgi:hypothetical protein